VSVSELNPLFSFFNRKLLMYSAFFEPPGSRK